MVAGGGFSDPEVLENLKRYRNRSTLKMAAINMIAKQMASNEVADLRAQFQAIDTDKSGFIEIEEL